MAYKDREEERAYNKRYREENREKKRAHGKRYREENKEKIAVGKKEWYKKDYQENREKYRLRAKKYQEENREKENARHKRYLEKNGNLEKRRAYEKRYREEGKGKKAGKKYRKGIRDRVFTHYGGGSSPMCLCCGETINEFLCIDHIHGKGAEHREKIGSQGGMSFYIWLIKNNFPPGYQVLCFNCNSAKGLFGACPHDKMGGKNGKKD